MNVRVTQPYPQSRDSQGKDTVLASSAGKKTCNYDTECSNRHPSLSTLKPKGQGLSKMKWWAIYRNLPVNLRFRLPDPWREVSHDQENFLAPSADKETCSYDKECSSHQPTLSTLRPKRVSCSKMKRRTIFKYLPLNVIVRQTTSFLEPG